MSQAPFPGEQVGSCQARPRGRASGLLLRELWVLEAACHGACPDALHTGVSSVSRGCSGLPSLEEGVSLDWVGPL